MEQPSPEVERFDELFNRLRTAAAQDLGGQIARIILFDSQTRSQETGELLYSPSITVCYEELGNHLHLKRRELEQVPTNTFEEERREEAVKKLGGIQKLANRST